MYKFFRTIGSEDLNYHNSTIYAYTFRKADADQFKRERNSDSFCYVREEINKKIAKAMMNDVRLRHREISPQILHTKKEVLGMYVDATVPIALTVGEYEEILRYSDCRDSFYSEFEYDNKYYEALNILNFSPVLYFVNKTMTPVLLLDNEWFTGYDFDDNVKRSFSAKSRIGDTIENTRIDIDELELFYTLFRWSLTNCDIDMHHQL